MVLKVWSRGMQRLTQRGDALGLVYIRPRQKPDYKSLTRARPGRAKRGSMNQTVPSPPEPKLRRLLGLFSRRPERAGYTLYGAAVAAARMPVFYSDWGVPDTLDGRFDLVGLHVYLLIERLNKPPSTQGAA